MGGSNGGLLVGAVMQQRPELFAAALPAVGVMDMLRYDRFTGGQAWAIEYGSSSDAADFPVLLKYSPAQKSRMLPSPVKCFVSSSLRCMRSKPRR